MDAWFAGGYPGGWAGGRAGCRARSHCRRQTSDEDARDRTHCTALRCCVWEARRSPPSPSRSEHAPGIRLARRPALATLSVHSQAQAALGWVWRMGKRRFFGCFVLCVSSLQELSAPNTAIVTLPDSISLLTTLQVPCSMQPTINDLATVYDARCDMRRTSAGGRHWTFRQFLARFEYERVVPRAWRVHARA